MRASLRSNGETASEREFKIDNQKYNNQACAEYLAGTHMSSKLTPQFSSASAAWVNSLAAQVL
jgi:hypothetical protein